MVRSCFQPDCYGTMQFPPSKKLLCLALLLLLPSPFVHAESLTYNGGVTNSGVWTNGGGGWSNGVTNVNWNNATTDSAIFAGATPTTVNVEGGVIVSNISVTSGTYTMAGTGTLTLSNTTWDVASGLTNTVSTALAGTTGFTKMNAGVLLLNGTNKNYTGTTVINGGAIQITNALAGNLGSTTTNAITLNGGALYTLFPTNTTVNYAITVGASGGELRNLGSDTQRFTFVSNKIYGSGVLTLSIGASATRFVMGTTTQTNFAGKWVINSNALVDVDGANTFGNVTGDDAITLINSGTILFRGARTYGTNSLGTYGITVGSGGGKINGGGNLTLNLAHKITGAAGNTLTLGVDNNTILILSNTNNSYAGDTSIVQASGTTNGTVRLGAAGVIPDGASAGNVTVNAGTTLDLNGFSETINGLSGSGGINNSSNAAATLTVGGNNQSSTFSGAISNSVGALSLEKTGSGTLTLSGNSTYSGATTISEGTLQIGSGGTGGSIGSTSGVTNNGTLAYNRSDNLTASYAISGAGAVTKSGAGTLTLSGSNSYSGTTTISAGVLEITNGSAIADAGAVTLSNVSGAGLAVNSSETIGSLRSGGTTGGNVSIASGQTLTVAETGIQSFAGSITNSGSLTKSGVGTLTLSGSNSFSGGTTVRGGRLVASSTNAFGSGNILVQANSTNRAAVVLSNITMTGKTLTLDSSTHRATLLSGGASGATWNGDIVLTGSASANGTTELANDTGNGPLTVAGTITGSISGGGALTLRGAGTTVTNVLSASVNIGSTPLTKTDDGNWQITSSGNTWSNTTISAGVLSVGSGGATGELGVGNITNNATLVVNRTGAITITNTISGTGALVKLASGTLTLSGSTANTYAGATTISNGTLQLLKTAGVDAVAGSSLTVSSGAVLLLSASDQVKDATAITLSGGTIQRVSGVSEVFGNLNVTSASFLDYSSGTTGTLQFQNYTNTGSSLVSVANFLPGNKLQFLSSSFGTGDLVNFSFSSGYTTGTVGSYFTITAVPETSTFAAGLMLVALFATAVWRGMNRKDDSLKTTTRYCG